MTKQQARDFIAKYPGARNFTKPSHFELPDLLEVHIEALTVTRADFHDLTGGVQYPKKETIDKFGIAAGVSYNTMIESTRKDGNAFVGRSQGMTMGPDGQPIMGDVCEYEFDPELRAEEDFIKKPENYQSEGKKRLKVLEYTKMGRQRANTGARSRATLAVLGIQTGFKDLKPEEVFLFSRIMVNTKNQLLAQAMINNFAGNTRALFGPQGEAPRQISGTVTHAADAEPASPAPSMDFEPEEPVDPIKLKKSTVLDLLDRYGAKLGKSAVDSTRAWIEGDQLNVIPEADLDDVLAKIKGTLERQGVQVGAA